MYRQKKERKTRIMADIIIPEYEKLVEAQRLLKEV